MKKVIYYSRTGHTKEVATKINEAHGYELDQIMATSDDPNQTFIELTHSPDITLDQTIILGSPVHGFSVPKIVVAYLNQFDDFKGKTFELFVTHFFYFRWMGASQTLKQLKRIIESKGGTVTYMGSVEWWPKKIDRLTKQLIDDMKP